MPGHNSSGPTARDAATGPGGRFAAEAGEPAGARTLPPPPAGPPDFAALAQAAARHGITILAPPPRP
jgi:hypothetical protein